MFPAVSIEHVICINEGPGIAVIIKTIVMIKIDHQLSFRLQ
jgi:hypothetical protein